MAAVATDRSPVANSFSPVEYWKRSIQRNPRNSTLTTTAVNVRPLITRSYQVKATMPTSIASSVSPNTTFLSQDIEGGGLAQQNGSEIIQTSSRPSSSRALHPIKESTPSHTRRGSSATTESATTSPTTTASTDDSTLTDPSPSSSPESPNISTLKEGETPTSRSMDSSRTLSLEPVQGSQDRVLPGKRFRNTKGLAINTVGISTIGSKNPKSGHASAASLPALSVPKPLSSIPSLNDPVRPFSEPSTPAFIVPSFPPPRKSKLGLTITTPDSRGNIAVPQTPLRGTMNPLPLRTRTSDLQPVPETPVPLSAMRENSEGQPLFSPSMAPRGGMTLPAFGRVMDPTLPTPSFGPEGGMRFPNSNSSENSPFSRTTRPPLNLPPRNSFDSPNSSSVIQHTIEHIPSTPLHDLPLSQEAKSPGYPEGPICIYPPSVYLYHQPTRKEAREFDVIINVAREVTNPFSEPDTPTIPTAEPKYKDAGVQCMLLVGPGEKAQEIVPESAVDDDEPSTPKASPSKPKNPEYIHLPWEHNSKVYEEWLKICELIDNRVDEGKKVLIHCQLGVSRSASLIVAYGIYKNPRLTPDEAREKAKQRSRFIDLNMHFMYELGDFKKLLAEKRPQDQAPRRPGGFKPLQRTMTDSVLVMNSSNHELMSPILDEPEEDNSQEQSDTFSAAPQSAPLVSRLQSSERSASPAHINDSPRPESEEHTRSGDKTPLASEQPLKLTLPPPPKPTKSESTPKPPVPDTESKPLPPLPPSSISIPKTRPPEDLKSPPPLQLALPPRPTIENPAQNRNLLPSPHLELPPPTGLSQIPGGRRLRPMPSLPAGFSSIRSASANTPGSTAPFADLKLAIEALKSPVSTPGVEEGLLSPRAQEFVATPFHRPVRSLAGDLAEHVRSPTVRNSGLQDAERDPRSPPARGDVVLGSIDDILG